MSQVSVGVHGGHSGDHAGVPVSIPDDANVRLGDGAMGLSRLLLGVGVLGVGGAVGLSFVVGLKHALASYLVGFAVVLGLTLGGLFWVMVLRLTQAGWSSTLRRVPEAMMSLVPVCLGLFLPLAAVELAMGGVLYKWMNSAYTAGDPLAEHKAPFLNPAFFTVRAVVYFAVWTFLAVRLYRLSTEQDRTGDKWLTNKAARTSTYGMLLFALCTAFASFDWLMSIDFHFFSTMWGVYFFAGAAYGSVALVVLVLASLRSAGKLGGLVGEEHFHDLGKLMFGFTVFWAYIAFSQYFLIWYSNIPEETAFFLHRTTGGWRTLGQVLVVGHFVGPFLLLLFRGVKRRPGLVRAIAAWMILMHVADLYWIVRPMVYASGEKAGAGPLGFVLDGAAIGGVMALWLGLLVRRLASGPLVPLKDPRLGEALEHKNYV